MGVPEEIRRVKRPTNTVVVDQGGKSSKRYAVRERKGVKYVKGHFPQPVSGSIIGHIINGAYVPKGSPVEKKMPDFLSWGAPALIESLSRDILADLLKVMDCKDAFTVLVMAALRVIYPGVKNCRLQFQYHKSFLSVFFPGIPLSKNTVSKFLDALGANLTARTAFFWERLKSVSADHHIIIDGTLVQDTSRINDLSGFSYKARIKGCKELSILYAFDLEKSEPLCAQVFPGSHPDVATCKSFLKTNHIEKGILVADKGFNLKTIREVKKEHPDLHYLVALKRNDKRLKELGLLRMKDFVKGEAHPVLCAKAKVGNAWIYAFKDTGRAAQEERTCMAAHEKNNDFDPDAFDERRETFGVLAFESDTELSCEAAYATYKNRWAIELLFKEYKTGLEVDKTCVQGDYAVIGSEFINTICTIITSRIISAERAAGLLDNATYGDLLMDLREAWRLTDFEGKPHTEDNGWVQTTICTKEILAKLGLAEAPLPPEPKKKGRPKKAASADPAPKRKPGRPRIHPRKEKGENKKPGRPRKVKPELVGPKRPRGRPKKSATL